MNVLEKTLEEISEVEKEYVTGHKVEKECVTGHTVLYALGATGMATEISGIIRSHMDEEKDDGWISVKKRLPEGKEVIAQNKDGEMLIGYVYYSEEMEWYECVSESMYLTNVIAWQPLPEPYKEE